MRKGDADRRQDALRPPQYLTWTNCVKGKENLVLRHPQPGCFNREQRESGPLNGPFRENLALSRPIPAQPWGSVVPFRA